MKEKISKENFKIDSLDDVKVAMLCTCQQEDGTVIYSYVLMDPLKAHEYELAIKKGEAIDLTAFGEIISIGEGAEPPEEVRKEMEDKYRVNHNFESDMRKVMSGLDNEYENMTKRGVSTVQFFEKKLKELFND